VGGGGEWVVRFVGGIAPQNERFRIWFLVGTLGSFEVTFYPRSVAMWSIVRSGGLCQWKIPMTPSGIETATFRFVPQYLNNCATISGTHLRIDDNKYSFLLRHLLFWYSFFLQAALRQVHSLFQSQFSAECDLVLPFFAFQ
jgi:hypothetical protein